MKGEEREEIKSKVRRWSGLKLGIVVILILLCTAAGTTVGTGLFVARALEPMPQADKPVRVTIAAGSSMTEIAHELEKSGLIRNDLIFTYYVKYKKEGTRFQAGQYEMSPGITHQEIIDKLNRGDIVKEAMNRITVPEGFTAAQIAGRLADLQMAGLDDVMSLIDKGKDLTSPWVAAIPDNPGIRHRLEGYLFPETYELKKDASANEIVQRMLSELDRKLESLPPDWQEKMKARGLTFHQLLTVASLIEREAALDEERPLIAGVIYNRLSKKMPLQIDATIQYLFDQPKERLVEKDLRLESPYNTYLHEGLPPGPIASPSLSSIQAALEPKESNYLYYVTKKDGTKGHLFAETFEEHQRNIAQSRKNGQG